ncbi:hypothetical protein GQ54DRAFT_331003 [Martensiomyces pterosporus]|nr:hypothetical protein GQ54DRAFT_331003 [Martensiomyces pterosporus]
MASWADSPGAWLFHCHFDWHMGLGLNSVFVEAPEKMPDVINVPQSVIDQCKIQGKKVGGNAVGNTSYNYDGAPNAPNLLANRLGS